MNKQITQMKFLVLAIITLFCLTAEFKAQTTQYTYQGRLNDTTVASPTNGTYEMLFKLFTTVQTGTGTQIDAQLIPTVQVVNGIFTVQLNAENSFNSGADLFIEISVRPAGSSAAATTLSPRQQITSAPYSIQSRNALSATNSNNLGGVAASSYTLNTDSRLSDDRNPTANSANYIQNTSSPQSSSNFNVSGNGTAGGTLSANVVNSQTNFKIGGATIFSTPNPTSVVVGQLSNHNVTAANNSFFGSQAGKNTTGEKNTFFGALSGSSTVAGTNNTFVGFNTKDFNGNGNVIVGADGVALGSNNTLLGYKTNADGSGNTLLGFNTSTGNGVFNSTVIGSNAFAVSNNTIVLGTNLETTQIPGALEANGFVTLTKLGAAGLTPLCRNSLNIIGNCFDTAFNKNQQSENAAMMKDISDQKARLEAQQTTIDALKKLVCATNSTADVCKEVK